MYVRYLHAEENLYVVEAPGAPLSPDPLPCPDQLTYIGDARATPRQRQPQ